MASESMADLRSTTRVQRALLKYEGRRAVACWCVTGSLPKTGQRREIERRVGVGAGGEGGAGSGLACNPSRPH